MRRITIYACGILFFCTILGSCKEWKEESMYKTVNISGQKYRIPAVYIQPDLATSLVPRVAEMDVDDGVNLQLMLSDLAITPLPHTIPNGNANKVHILLYGTSEFNITNKYGLNPDAYHAWMRLGNYLLQRAIEKDEKTGLYRILRRHGTYSWQYFEEPPSETGNLNMPVWVAACSVFSGAEADDMSNVSCRTHLSSEWGNADISFTGRYINQVDKIKEGIQRKFQEWVVLE